MGRRWITIDTSRLSLACQRLLTARFKVYKLRPVTAEDWRRNPDGTWLPVPTPERQETAALQDAARGPEAPLVRQLLECASPLALCPRLRLRR